MLLLAGLLRRGRHGLMLLRVSCVKNWELMARGLNFSALGRTAMAMCSWSLPRFYAAQRVRLPLLMGK
jgi:hypothetical protein